MFDIMLVSASRITAAKSLGPWDEQVFIWRDVGDVVWPLMHLQNFVCCVAFNDPFPRCLMICEPGSHCVLASSCYKMMMSLPFITRASGHLVKIDYPRSFLQVFSCLPLWQQLTLPLNWQATLYSSILGSLRCSFLNWMEIFWIMEMLPITEM